MVQAEADKIKAEAVERVMKIIQGARKALVAVSVVIDREAWLTVGCLCSTLSCMRA